MNCQTRFLCSRFAINESHGSYSASFYCLVLKRFVNYCFICILLCIDFILAKTDAEISEHKIAGGHRPLYTHGQLKHSLVGQSVQTYSIVAVYSVSYRYLCSLESTKTYKELMFLYASSCSSFDYLAVLAWLVS